MVGELRFLVNPANFLISKLFWYHFVWQGIRNDILKIPMYPLWAKNWQSFEVYDIFIHCTFAPRLDISLKKIPRPSHLHTTYLSRYSRRWYSPKTIPTGSFFLQTSKYSRTPRIRPPSESHWCGRIRGMVAREGFRYAALLQQRHTKCGRMRGMVVGEGGRSTGVLLYTFFLEVCKLAKNTSGGK